MKKYIVFSLMLFALMSCKTKNKFEEDLIRHNREIVKSAFETGDIPSAIFALHSLMIYDTANIDLMDTLASLYMQVEDHNSAFRISVKMLGVDGEDLRAIEKYATNAARLNLSSDALAGYTKLYEKSQKVSYLYEMGIQNYNLGDVKSGEAIMNSIINMPESLTDIYLVKLKQNQYLQVPVISMVYFFLGTFDELQGKKKDAIEKYKKSVEFAPNFFKATERLEVLNR